MNLSQYQTLEQERSLTGQSIRAFAKQKAIPYTSYLYWKRKANPIKKQEPSFIPIEVEEPTADIILELPSGLKVKVPSHFNKAHLKSILDALV